MHTPAHRNGTTAAMILDAAQDEFSHYGFKKVTMSEIARSLDMGKASLYYYFPTKENLFRAVITREHDRFMAVAGHRMSRSASARGKIEAFVLERAEYFSRILNLNVLDIRSSNGVKPMFREMFDAFTEEELKVVRGAILEGRRSGEFTVRSEDKVAEALLHILQGLRMRFLRRLDSAHLKERHFQELKQEQRFVTGIFLRGIQRQATGT